jgi:hypothetical protein
MHYRLYFFNASNHVTHAVYINCDADEQILAAARYQGYCGKVEIWQAQRKVGACGAIEAPDRDGTAS